MFEYEVTIIVIHNKKCHNSTMTGRIFTTDSTQGGGLGACMRLKAVFGGTDAPTRGRFAPSSQLNDGKTFHTRAGRGSYVFGYLGTYTVVAIVSRGGGFGEGPQTWPSQGHSLSRWKQLPHIFPIMLALIHISIALASTRPNQTTLNKKEKTNVQTSPP
jgi:hypothetical protein